ncbi:Transcriptional activator DEMETER [Quillaja saponaria]|uniref:Transcriptional activator DEMETER n=1 Tax=Quillaja saponaria TaxID=32244 RepID=A0AAD7M5T3_QUISA|nr:Transcriptional activator DEMETER [Quillaja saponaria]
MGKGGRNCLVGNDKEKDKWWEEERKIFKGRADSFIARMHLVQGDRSFSQRKGSVVDSVVGVFLTQNVADHLSSSAYMSLGARFPLTSNDNRACGKVDTNIVVKEPQIRIINPDDTLTPLRRSFSQATYNQGLVTLHGTRENWRQNGTSGTRTTLVQPHNQITTKELISSQDSRNSSIIQGTGGKYCSGFTSYAEGPTTGSNSSNAHVSPSNFFKIKENTMFQEFYSSVTGRLPSDDWNKDGHRQHTLHAKQKTRLDSRDNTSCHSTFTYPSHLETPQIQLPAIPKKHSNKANVKVLKPGKLKAESAKKSIRDWDYLRKKVEKNGKFKQRSKDTMDSLDYEAVRHTTVSEIANAIDI